MSISAKTKKSISVKTQKMLWGRAAGRCSKPDCRVDLYEDETETDDSTLVGENCHIVAEKDDGPRPDPAMPVARRNSYANLILLCRNHHKVIDAQEGEYTVELLHRMKSEHEAWAREKLGFDAASSWGLTSPSFSQKIEFRTMAPDKLKAPPPSLVSSAPLRPFLKSVLCSKVPEQLRAAPPCSLA